MSKQTCSFEEPDVLAACAGDNEIDCMRAWQQRGNAATCVRCVDCTTGDCAMRCSNAKHPEAPLKRMDCAEGCEAGTCKDTLECGDHDDIFVDTYNAEKVTKSGEDRAREAKDLDLKYDRNCEEAKTRNACDVGFIDANGKFQAGACIWDGLKCKTRNEPESLARVGLYGNPTAAACTGDPSQDAFIPGCM